MPPTSSEQSQPFVKSCTVMLGSSDRAATCVTLYVDTFCWSPDLSVYEKRKQRHAKEYVLEVAAYVFRVKFEDIVTIHYDDSNYSDLWKTDKVELYRYKGGACANGCC